MKKIFYFLFIALTIGLTSCSKDDDKTPSGSDEIFGRWNITEIKMKGSFVEEGIPVEFSGTSKEFRGENYINLKNDQTFEAKTSEIDMEVEFKMLTITYTEIIVIGEQGSETGTWTQQGDKLRITSASTGEIVEYTIIDQSGTSIKVTANESALDLGNDMPEDAEFSVTITFTKN